MKTLDSLTKEDKIACIKNWVEELNQEAYEAESTRKLLEEYRKSNNILYLENEALKSSKSPSQEEVNKLVNDKIAMIFSNPLTYLMSLSESERNEFIGKIYTLITGIKFI